LSAGVEVVTPTTLSSTSNKRVEIQPKRNEKHNKNSEIKKRVNARDTEDLFYRKI